MKAHRPGRRRTAGALGAGLAAAALVAGLGAGLPTAAATSAETQPNWPITYFDLERTWAESRGDGVVVGLVDGNVQADHPDLAGQVVEQTYLDQRATDPSTHGTEMASLIVGSGGRLVDGIAPGARLVVAGGGSQQLAIGVDDEGIRWAVDQGASVINLSYSQGYAPRPEQQAAIEYALANDVVVVAAAGNAPADTAITVPASYPGVIAVSAIDGSSVFCRCSVADPGVVVAAPGFQLVAASPGETGYSVGDGTSGAAAIVSGVAALVRSAHPELDAANVVNRIVATARDAGATGRDPEFGFGIIDPLAAVTADVPLVDANPLLGDESTPEQTVPPTDPPASEPTTSSSLPGGSGTVGGGGPSASTEAPLGVGQTGGSSTTTLVVVGVAAVVLLGGAGVLLSRGRRRPGPTAPPTG